MMEAWWNYHQALSCGMRRDSLSLNSGWGLEQVSFGTGWGATGHQCLVPVTWKVSLLRNHCIPLSPQSDFWGWPWTGRTTLHSGLHLWTVMLYRFNFFFFGHHSISSAWDAGYGALFQPIMNQNIQLESLFPSSCYCCYIVKQPQLSRKYHHNEHIIGQGRINCGSWQPFHPLQRSQEEKKKKEPTLNTQLLIKCLHCLLSPRHSPDWNEQLENTDYNLLSVTARCFFWFFICIFLKLTCFPLNKKGYF